MKQFFIAIALFCSFSASSQIRLGAIGGLTYANQNWNTNGQVYEGTYLNRLSFHLGATADIPVAAAWSVQPELYFTNQGSSYKSQIPNLSNESTLELGYIKMPVCLTYMYDAGKTFWYVGAGPYLSRVAFSKYTFIQNDVRIKTGAAEIGRDIEDQVVPYDYGFKVKGGFEMKKGINVGMYWEPGVKDINPQFVKTFNRAFGLSLSYLFSVTAEDKYNRYPDDYNW
jgi:hypothetical protein